MTNAVRGLVTAELGGKTWSLEFTIDSLCQLEDLLDKTSVDILREVAQGNARLRLTRALIWAALRRHHSEITVEAAGELLRDPAGPAFAAAVSDAFLMCWPQADPDAKAEGDGEAGNPPTAAPAGTGGRSSSSGSSAAAARRKATGAKPPAASS